MKDIWNELENWTQKGEPFALARVIQTWGSAPRHAGSAMIVGKDMEVAGSVSGGCIEGAVIEAAQQVLQGGATKQLTYGGEDETAGSGGLSCGGEVSVLVERHWAFAKGDAIMASTLKPPADSPKLVTLSGSPPNSLIFCEIHLSDWMKSSVP